MGLYPVYRGVLTILILNNTTKTLFPTTLCKSMSTPDESQCWLKAPYIFIFSLDALRYCHVNRRESGRCHAFFYYF